MLIQYVTYNYCSGGNIVLALEEFIIHIGQTWKKVTIQFVVSSATVKHAPNISPSPIRMLIQVLAPLFEFNFLLRHMGKQ